MLPRTCFKALLSRSTINTKQSHTFWGPTVVAQDYFWYHYFIRSRSTPAAKAISEAPLSLYTLQQSIVAYYGKQAMGFGRRTRVPNEGRVPQSAATLGYALNFVFYPPAEPPWMPSQSVDQGDSGHGGPLMDDTETLPYPTPPVLEGAIPAESTEAASVPELNLGPSSLSHVFPFSLPSSATPQSKTGGQTPAPAPPNPPHPTRWYLHRAPNGTLTTIGPSPLCQDATTGLLEEAEENLEHGVIYAGYRVFNKDPRKCLGFVPGDSTSNENHANTGLNATSEEKEFEYAFDVELPPDEPSSFPFSSGDETSDGYCSKSSTGSFTMRRTFPISKQSLGPFELELCSEPIHFEKAAQHSFMNHPSPEETKQTRGQNLTITIPTKSQPLFNPSLKQENKFNHDLAERPIHPDSRDLARIQFKNRRGALWNMANKDLEELLLHASILLESEFLDLVFCERDEVKTWLDSRGPRLIQRSMKKWIKANDALRNAGIRPCEINEEVKDIFELMTPQEQAEFIERYQKLFALVKSSQERLHLTPSEIKHFSILSLADKYDFLEEYKTRREEREKIIRRDTAIFTAKLRRTQRESDELPFADYSSPNSLQSLNGLVSKTPRKSAPTTVDNFHLKFLQFGMGQEKVGKLDSLSTSTHLPTALFASPVIMRADSKVDSSNEQQTQRRPTAFTGDGRIRHRKRDEIKTTDERAKSNQVSGLVVQYDSGLDPEGCIINVREVMASEEEDMTELAKDRVQIKSHAEALKHDFKQEVNTNNLESKVLDNCFQDCGQFATSLLTKVLNRENDHEEDVDTEQNDTTEALCPELVLERSPRKEWLGMHPGAKVAFPTPPPTEHSAEGVIPPITSEHLPVNEKPLTNMCTEDTLPVATATPTLAGTKSESCTPCADVYRDVLTKDLETCSIRVDVLSSPRAKAPCSSSASISYVTPPRPSHGSVRGSPSGYSSECDLKKDNRSEQSPRSLRKKVSTFFSSLRSKRSRGALKDLKY